MTKKRILQLLPLMPGNAPFLGGIEPSAVMPAAARRSAFLEKYSRCMSDPAFGWHFVEAFLASGRSFPVEAVDSSLLRAYYWHTNEIAGLRSVVDAMRFALPQNGEQDILQAMLLIPNLDPREICRLLTISLPALRIYTDLFFNVVDRRDEPDYIRGLVYPETRRVTLKPDYLEQVPTTYLLRRVAFEHGLEALKCVAGLRSTYEQGIPAAEAAKRLESEIFRAANFVLALGGANSSAPVLKHARALASSGRKTRVEERNQPNLGLDGVSVDIAIGEHLRKAIAPDPLQLLQQRLDEETVAPS